MIPEPRSLARPSGRRRRNARRPRAAAGARASLAAQRFASPFAAVVTIIAVVFASMIGIAAISTATAPAANATVPGTPGTPQAGTTVFNEDFENNPAATAVNYSTYVGATPAGETYTGSSKWINGARCNGVILDYANATTPAWAQSGSTAADSGTNGRCSDSSGVRSYQFLRMLALAMGQQFTPGAPTTNHVVSSYTECQSSSSNGGTCDTLPTGSAIANGSVMFKTAQPIATTPGHYYVFGVNTAYMNCGLASGDPKYQFATVDPILGTLTSIGQPLNGCQATTDPNVTASTQSVTSSVGGAFGSVTKTVNINSMTTNQAFQATGTSMGIAMYNLNGATNGNDGAFDNVRLVDVTPQLDKSFSPAVITAGQTSTVTLTVTNTSELDAKNDWSITDTLPAGVVIAPTPAVGGTCAQVTGAAFLRTAVPGLGVFSATGGDLAAGQASCTITFNVTAAVTGTYVNGAANVVTNLNPPGDATLVVRAPVSCDGSTIYALEHNATNSDNGGPGYIYALQTSTVAGATVTPTLVTATPSGGGGYLNSMGITPGGTAIYAISQNDGSSTNKGTIYRFDALTQSWAQFSNGYLPSNTTVVAGAVNPANGIYYYVALFGASGNNAPYARVYGFNTTTNTPINGVIAQFNLPGTDNGATQNGDIAFDLAGNMYVVYSDGVKMTVGVVNAPLATTAANEAKTLKTISETAATKLYNGIALDNAGHLYVQSSTGAGTNTITELNPNNGAVIAGPTLVAGTAGGTPGGVNNDQTSYNVDLAACSLNPTLSLQKNVAGRYTPTDQFALSMTGGGITQNNTATTTGTTTGVQTAVAGPVIGQSGSTYTLSETAASGSLSSYASTYSCVDTANGNAVIASGTGQSFQLTFPATVTVSPNILCTFTNAPRSQPTITLTKALGAPREAATDQFTVALRTGGASGTVVNSTANSTTTGTGSTVTAGKGTTGTYVATAGTAYTLTEAAAGTASLANYKATITCTDSAGLQTGLPNGAVFDPASPPSITPVPGANISCIVTNTAQPIMSWDKVVDKGANTIVNPGDTLKYTISFTNSGSVPNPSFTAFDDLTNVVNNAAFNTGSITITPAATGVASYDPATKHLNWTGPVAANSTVTVSYTVTVNAGAFGQLKNAFIDKTVVNPIGASLKWRKIDASAAKNLLAGSAWTLTALNGAGQPTGAPIAVTDCVAASAASCAGADTDPIAGQFLLKGLTPGDYRLVETKAPVGFVLNSTPIAVTVSATAQTTVLADVVNQQQHVPMIPLTGGLGTDHLVMIGGGLLVLMLGLGTWQFLRRRRAT